MLDDNKINSRHNLIHVLDTLLNQTVEETWLAAKRNRRKFMLTSNMFYEGDNFIVHLPIGVLSVGVNLRMFS